MEVTYSNKKLQKVCEDNREAIKKYGFNMAVELEECITILKAIDSVESLLMLDSNHHCHPLRGNRSGQYSMWLINPYRLIFEKADNGELHIVNIIEIVDYHRG